MDNLNFSNDVYFFRDLDDLSLFDFFEEFVIPYLKKNNIISLHDAFVLSRDVDFNFYVYNILSSMWHRYWGKEFLRSYFRSHSKKSC